MTTVAGIDSSTQSCKIVLRDADSGSLLASATAPHPDGTEVDPEHWWQACRQVVAEVGGLSEVAALSVGGQQHGLICLDEDGRVIRPALLWNDTRSAPAAAELVAELGDGDEASGRAVWARVTGVVPVASITIAKARWLADHEPEHARRIAAICLPHDWLTWRLSGSTDLADLVTDRSDASGTGWFDPVTNRYRRDLLARALRREESEVADIVLPRVLSPAEAAGHGDPAQGWGHVVLGPGCGDNAGAALGLGLQPGQTFVSLGTSGVVASVSAQPVNDPSGLVPSFADATGAFLPLACTLNGSRVLDATATLLGVDHDELSRLALAAEPGAAGLVLLPYLEGERTPNLPDATGTLTGLTLGSMTRDNLARAGVEGLLRLMRTAMDAVGHLGVPIERVSLIGGGARSEAVRALAPSMLAVDVDVPEPGEYVADGAARQAAWVLAGTDSPPDWP
ncbi:MAG TPA: xylulokinase [Candidatus Avipropionibacterium avicola]|uniref:Xylulose kinase n=1 Tax=Candidatus Avipropionibacterium avicola TaxID=2840701 RepID=A0A9D1GYX1_9ACTN|nr:xylulokinase [Candidatus Avipropionibacterium avicola]